MAWFIGTSGWTYPHWQGPFYPRDLAPAHWLAYYAQCFSAVEIDRSFYRWPTADQFAAWRTDARLMRDLLAGKAAPVTGYPP